MRTLAVIALGLLVVWLRRPETLTQAEFYTEDGQVFYLGTYFGSFLDQILRVYHGFLQMTPRLIAAASRTVPIDLAPLVANGLSLVVVALLAAFAASERLENVIPDRRRRLALGLLVLLLPGGQEPLGSMTYVSLYGGLFLVFAAVMGSPRSRLEAVGERLAVAVAGLSGPFGLLLAPAFLLRLLLRRDRPSAWLAGVVGVAGAVQLAALVLVPDRPPGEFSDPATVVAVWAGRAVGGAILGQFWTAVVIALGPPVPVVVVALGLIAAGLVVVALQLPRHLLTTLAYAYVAILLAGIVYHPEPIRFLLDNPYFEGRYFFISNAIVAVIIVLGVPLTRAWSRRAGIALAAVLALGIVGDARLVPRPTHDWAVRNDCIGGPDPCDVPVEPPNVWTIHWPGASGAYDQGGWDVPT